MSGTDGVDDLELFAAAEFLDHDLDDELLELLLLLLGNGEVALVAAQHGGGGVVDLLSLTSRNWKIEFQR